MKKSNSKKSFTLIELLVTSAIIMIMLAVTIAYSQRGEGINKVNRMIERLSFDIRRISNLSTQTQEIGDKKICG
ncbi:MAG: prepilin-type N-terminal cleavage/methylation domain-containing protein [Candidatus Paceibacterota bacterium]|jgi:type II secretory pathway pseudopilin PulG